MPAATYSRITNQAKKDICDEIPSKAVYDSHTLQGTGFSLFQHCWGTAPAQHPEVSNRSDKMHQNSWLQTFDRKKYYIRHRLELNYFLPVFVWTLFNGHQASHSPEKSENWEPLIKDIFFEIKLLWLVNNTLKNTIVLLISKHWLWPFRINPDCFKVLAHCPWKCLQSESEQKHISWTGLWYRFPALIWNEDLFKYTQ